MFPKVFRFVLNSDTEEMELVRKIRLFQISVPLKCTEFVPEFARANGKAGLLLRLHVSLICFYNCNRTKLNSGFDLDLFLIISATKYLNGTLKL